MKARNILKLAPTSTEWKGEEFKYAEHKLDGRRITIGRHKDGVIAVGREPWIDLWPVLSRNQDVHEGILKLPHGTVIVGEAHVPSVNRSGDIPAAWKTGKWTFTPFAVPRWEGENLATMRLLDIRSLIKTHTQFMPPELSMITDEWTKPKMLDYIKTMGIEGLMLKVSHLYRHFKLKPVLTFDGVVRAVYEGESRNRAKLGGLVIALYQNNKLDVVCRCGGGFKKKEREDWWQENLIGRVCEVAYEKLGANGIPLFPRFKRWREDKPAHECRKDQLK